MILDADTRAQLLVDTRTTFDPTGSIIELEVGGVWWPCSWDGSPLHVAETSHEAEHWRATAHTTGYFAGPEVALDAIDGAAVLGLGRHRTQTRVTKGGQILAADSSPIDVG